MNKIYLNYHNNIQYKYILLTFDDNYVLQASELILSIKCNTKQKICFIVMVESLSDKSIDNLSNLDIPIIIYSIDSNIFDLKKDSKWPYIIFAKLIAPYIIEEEMEYLYYMDCDFLCINNIDSMFDVRFEQLIAMCPELSGNMVHHSSLCDMKENYANCGFVIYNCKNFKERYDKSEIIESINSKMDEFVCYEQDFMNYYFKGDIRLLNQILFNNQVHEYFRQFKLKGLIKNTIFIHFSWKKPWNNDANIKSIKLYLRKCKTKEMKSKVKRALFIHYLLIIPRFIMRVWNKVVKVFSKINNLIISKK